MDMRWLIGWPASLSVVVLGFELGIHEGRQGSHVATSLFVKSQQPAEYYVKIMVPKGSFFHTGL